MSTRLWFRLEDVLPLAEHALACPTHRLTGAQAAAGGSNGPALTLTHARTSGVLRSNGVPVWRDAHGEQQTVSSASWRPTASGTPSPTVESAFLPLRRRGRDHRRLIDVLHAGRDLDQRWLVIRPHTRPGEVLDSASGSWTTATTLPHRTPGGALGWLPRPGSAAGAIRRWSPLATSPPSTA